MAAKKGVLVRPFDSHRQAVSENRQLALDSNPDVFLRVRVLCRVPQPVAEVDRVTFQRRGQGIEKARLNARLLVGSATRHEQFQPQRPN